MKSPSANPGQIDLKGKKTKKLRCRCCVMLNLSDRERDNRHRKEMRDAMKCL